VYKRAFFILLQKGFDSLLQHKNHPVHFSVNSYSKRGIPGRIVERIMEDAERRI